MTWWAWLGFWVVFWAAALAYLAWRTWKLWPHARHFGRSVQAAWERADTARAAAQAVADPARRPACREITKVPDIDNLAWNRPAAAWRTEWRASRRRRRELRLDAHAGTWASWRRHVD